MPQTTDMMGRSLEVPAHPQRIISLVPSQTELLADLQLEKEVVGITKFCIHPDAWFRNKTRVGGTKQLHLETIQALRPDLIIANKEENERGQIEVLAAQFPVWLSDVNTLPDALEMIRRVGLLCGRADEAERIFRDVAAGFGTLAALHPRRRRVAYAIWRNPWMWVGTENFIHDVMKHCGLENVMAGRPRYPELSLEGLRTLQPELVILSSEPYPFAEKHLPEVRAALPESTVMLADGEMFSWYGSRLLQAPEYLTRLLQSC